MVQKGQLAQMADGLHVLGDTVNQLAQNYLEVLTRAESCNLTFKPSKVTICPKNIKLFGWELKDGVWFPTAHTTSALVHAPKPTTVKQLRSFLGSFKQLNASLPNYALVLHNLEQIVAGRASAERITWTNELEKSFTDAKQLAANSKGIAEPRPSDQLYTYSDYSADNRAVGGRLVIVRKQEDGSQIQLIGGFFSAVLDKQKQHWIPCEGEACAIRLVLSHFQNQIRESDHVTIHYTDSQPCVMAWKRSKRGAFSTSSRICAFLTNLSVLPVELHYKPGKELHTSDFASRNPPKCTASNCQICRFTKEWQDIGDNASSVRSLSIEDINSGKAIMPMIQKKVWKEIQMKDSIHCKLLDLIQTRQLPESKKTKGDYTKLKLLHNLFTQGKLFVENGLILVKPPGGAPSNSLISVPPSIFPGIVHTLHIRLDHPSKGQLSNLMSRYFYSPGWKQIINDVTDLCPQCAAVKKLPKVLLEDTTTIPESVASTFAADVIEREGQRILILRDCLSQYTRGLLLQDQKADTLRNALLALKLDIIPDSGADIRVDAATAFQSLEKESRCKNSILAKYNIRISVGRILNKNKNPVAGNAIKEVQKEILRIKPLSGPISQIDLALLLRNINSRIRKNSFTPKEILFRRETLSNQPVEVNDEQVKTTKSEHRMLASESSRKFKSKSKKPSPHQSFCIGDLVMLRDYHLVKMYIFLFVS